MRFVVEPERLCGTREVSYSPAMAIYLTFIQNRALHDSGTFPDEVSPQHLYCVTTTGASIYGSVLLSELCSGSYAIIHNRVMEIAQKRNCHS